MRDKFGAIIGLSLIVVCLIGSIGLTLILLKNNEEAINLAEKLAKYEYGTNYTITILDGFDETIFTFPEDQCGIELKVVSRMTGGKCEERNCEDYPVSILNEGDVSILTDENGNSYMSIPTEGGYWECVYHEREGRK